MRAENTEHRSSWQAASYATKPGLDLLYLCSNLITWCSCCKDETLYSKPRLRVPGAEEAIIEEQSKYKCIRRVVYITASNPSAQPKVSVRRLSRVGYWLNRFRL